MQPLQCWVLASNTIAITKGLWTPKSITPCYSQLNQLFVQSVLMSVVLATTHGYLLSKN